MQQFKDTLVQQWKTSPRYRVGLVFALAYFIFRLIINYSWQMKWLIVKGWPSSIDLRLFWDTGLKFRAQQDLYFKPLMNFSMFIYAPPFALLTSLISRIPYEVVHALYTLLIPVTYAVLYFRWFKLFERYGCEKVAWQMVCWLPVWLISSAIMYDATYMNIYTVMALLATLLLEAVLDEKLRWALLWLVFILPTKPHWAFALGIPFLRRRWRFGLKLLVGSVVVYILTIGITLLLGGYHYVFHQYSVYVHTLESLPRNVPWRTLSHRQHMDYNHSLMQVVVFFLGVHTRSFAITTILKVILWLPLVSAGWLTLRRRVPQPSGWQLEWAMALYAAVFILIDVMHEVTLVLILFTYLHVTLQNRALKWLLHLVVWPYLLADFLNLVTYSVKLPDLMQLVPLALFVLLTFYGLFVTRLLLRARSQPVQSEPV